MADVLSQSEIDALLNAMSSGDISEEQQANEEETHKVKLYDFKSPQKFSKEHIRTLELIHDNYARHISNFLTAQTRKNVKVKVETIEQITYKEFIHSIPNPTMLTLFKMEPLDGTVLFETNPEFSYTIIDILLGGNGDRKIKAKEFSDIDKNIMKQVIKGLIEYLKPAWENIIDIEPEIEMIETNPSLNQTMAPNDPVALVPFLVEMENSTTFINMCIPFMTIEKILDKLVIQYSFKNSKNEALEETRRKLEKGLSAVNLDVRVELGHAAITVEDFLRLMTGNVITLDTESSSPLKIFIGNEACYLGSPGTIGKKMGVTILEKIDDINQ